MVDHISPQIVSTIPIPRLGEDKEREIAEKVRYAERMRADANDILGNENDVIEEIVLNV